MYNFVQIYRGAICQAQATKLSISSGAVARYNFIIVQTSSRSSERLVRLEPVLRLARTRVSTAADCTARTRSRENVLRPALNTIL